MKRPQTYIDESLDEKYSKISMDLVNQTREIIKKSGVDKDLSNFINDSMIDIDIVMGIIKTMITK